MNSDESSSEPSLNKQIMVFEWRLVLESIEPREAHRFFDALRSQAYLAKDAEDQTAFEAWASLSRIFMPFLYDVPAAPKDRSKNDEAFNTLLSMLTQSDLDAAESIIDAWDDPEFVAHLGDLLWITRKNHSAAKNAALAYLASADRLYDPEHWPLCEQRYKRALILAAAVDFKRETFDACVAKIEEVLERLDGSDPLFLTLRLVSLLEEYKVGNRLRHAELCRKRGECGSDRHDTDSQYLQAAARMFESLGRLEESRACWILAAEAMVKHAETFRPGKGMRLAAPHWLAVAIHILRRTSGTEERANELQLLMMDWQRESIEDLVPISVSTPFGRELLEPIADLVGSSFEEAIWRLALLMRPTPKEQLRQSVDSSKTIAETVGSFANSRTEPGNTFTIENRKGGRFERCPSIARCAALSAMKSSDLGVTSRITSNRRAVTTRAGSILKNSLAGRTLFSVNSSWSQRSTSLSPLTSAA